MAISGAGELDDMMMLDRPRRWRSAAFPYLMFAPAFILIAGVSFVPIGYAIVQSFFRSSTLELGHYVGLRNYSDFFFTRDGIGSLENSLIFVAGTVALAVPFGVSLALVLNRPIPFRSFFRVILILPWLVSNLVGALLWAWIGNPQYGLVPYLLSTFGIVMPNIITDPAAAMTSVIVASVWASTPLVMVFVLAALQSIPLRSHRSRAHRRRLGMAPVLAHHAADGSQYHHDGVGADVAARLQERGDHSRHDGRWPERRDRDDGNKSVP